MNELRAEMRNRQGAGRREAVLSPARARAVGFLDRALELGLLTVLVVLPLGFQGFLVFIPLDAYPFSAWVPKVMQSAHTPLNLKEALAAFMAIYVLALWLARSILAGRLCLVWTPLHLPFLVLLAVAALTLLEPSARLLRLRDFSLVIGYCGFVHLFLLSARRRRFRRRSLDLFLWVGALFTGIVLAMDRQWYFGPFRMVLSDNNRQSLYATIGHNIAVASYLMILLVYVLGRAVETRSGWKRLGYGLWALLLAHLIVAAQTVGVWLALFLLVPVVVWQLLLGSGLGWRRLWEHRALRRVSGAALVAGALFVLLFTLNEVARRGRPGTTPMERLKMRLDPRIVVRGTRARLWTISIHLVRERFPLGVGFSAFKYVYPEAQARYFQKHPDSILVPTELHTDRVHNDYLQVWVELGALGLVALLWALAVFVRLQVRLLRSSRLRARERLRATTAFVALAATLLHLLTSFEFHVPTTVLFFVLGLSWWTGEGRLGRLKSFSMVNLSRRGAVALLLVGAIALAAVGFALWVGRHVIADSYFCLGEYLRKKEGNLAQAAECFDRSRQLAPYRGQVAYHQGFSVFRLADQYRSQGQQEKALRYLQFADQLLSGALETYQYKDIYYYRGRTRGMLGMSLDREELLNQAVRDYQKTIEIYPRELSAYYDLGKLYYSTQRQNLAFEVWKQAQAHDFDFMRDYHILDAEHAVAQGWTELAMEYYRMAIVLNPKNGDYYWPLLDLMEEAGRYQEGISLLKAFIGFYPEAYWAMARLAHLEWLAGNPAGAEAQLERIAAVRPVTQESAQAGAYCCRLLGREEDGIALLTEWLEEHWDERFFKHEFAALKQLSDAYRRTGQLEAEEALWKRLLALPEEQLKEVMRDRVLGELARFYVEQGRLLEALQVYRQRMELPDMPEDYGLAAYLQFLTVLELPLAF